MFGLNREGKSSEDQVGLLGKRPGGHELSEDRGIQGRSPVWGTSKVAVHCEIMPRTERLSTATTSGFNRLLDFFGPGYGLPTDCTRGGENSRDWLSPVGRRTQQSAEVGSTIHYFSRNGFHHSWRSAWEIHRVIKIGVMEKYWAIIADTVESLD